MVPPLLACIFGDQAYPVIAHVRGCCTVRLVQTTMWIIAERLTARTGDQPVFHIIANLF